MTRLKKVILLGTMVLAVGATSATAFAASTTTDAIGVTNLDELKAQRLELKKETLADRVEDGIMTQEQADAILTQIEANQVVCDGTGSNRTGQMMGAGFGGNGQGGRGQGQGQGQGFCGNCTQTQ